MNALGQFFQILYKTVTTLVPAFFKAAFTIKDAADSVQDQYVATIFGVPVWVVVLIGSIITIGGIIIAIAKWADSRL